MLFRRHDKKSYLKPLVVSLCILSVSVIVLMSLPSQNAKQYQQARAKAETELQFKLAEQLLRVEPDAIQLSYDQIDLASRSFKRLQENAYHFADPLRLKDARHLKLFSPNEKVAINGETRAIKEMAQLREFKVQMARIKQIETDFNDGFHRSPLHYKAIETGVKLPTFLARLDADYYLGALYQSVKEQPLNDYQLSQMLNHQNQVLFEAMAVKSQLDKLAQKMPLITEAADIHQCATALVEFHRQTQQYMLVSLIRNGLNKADSIFAQMSKVATSQMVRGQHDLVWKTSLKPLAHIQWKGFDLAYIRQIKVLRGAILEHHKGEARAATALSQTYPHAQLTYKYFWPNDDNDLVAFRDQGPQRKAEADKIRAVLDGIRFDAFDSLDQTYAVLTE